MSILCSSILFSSYQSLLLGYNKSQIEGHVSSLGEKKCIKYSGQIIFKIKISLKTYALMGDIIKIGRTEMGWKRV